MITAVYFNIMSIITFIVVLVCLLWYFEDDYSFLEGVFLHHILVQDMFEDDINKTGMIIIHTVLAIFTWPAIICNFITIGICAAGVNGWK